MDDVGSICSANNKPPRVVGEVAVPIKLACFFILLEGPFQLRLLANEVDDDSLQI